MSELAGRLAKDMIAALKAQDKFTLSVIRMLRSEIQYAEKESGSPLGDDQVLEILGRELKKRKESLAESQRFGREPAVAKLNREIEIIALYLPAPLIIEELKQIVRQAILELNATGKSDFGRVMAAVMSKVKGRAEGSQVSALVRELLA